MEGVHTIPLFIKQLTMPYYFQPFTTQLPNLTHLTFGDNFNHNSFVLPKTLTHLTFGIQFNQQLANLPPMLTHLTISGNFNQQVILPQRIEHITLGSPRGHYQSDSIPPFPNSLVSIHLFTYLSENKIITLPIHLTTCLISATQFPILHEPPKRMNVIIGCANLLELKLAGSITVNHLPSSLQRCLLGKQVQIQKKILPPKLLEFSLHEYIKFQHGTTFPSSLTTLSVNNNAISNIHKLPNLRTLEICDPNKKINPLPSSLTNLTITYLSQIDKIPLSITHLTLLAHKKQVVLDQLPNSITHLALPNYLLPITHIPPFLISLRVGSNKYPLPHLPPTLSSLELTALPNTPRINTTHIQKLFINIQSSETHTQIQINFFTRTLHFVDTTPFPQQ